MESVALDGHKGEEEEDVNFVSGVGFQNQKYGNQSKNRNFGGSCQINNYSQNSQHQNPFTSNNNFTRNYGASSY